jgi:hypothetical protein
MCCKRDQREHGRSRRSSLADSLTVRQQPLAEIQKPQSSLGGTCAVGSEGILPGFLDSNSLLSNG